MFSREHTIHLHRTIPGAELMILPGTGHFTFDEQPDMLLLAIDQFFKK
jgi:pimeloyl-ACP methyl ester carboxylesterase